MLVVWEPILMTDWGSPSGTTLAGISDIRAQQFWDPQHEVSKALSRTKPDPREKFHWDEAILYAPHSKWKDAPNSLFWRGPVYQVIPGLKAAIDGTVPQTH